MCTPKIKEEVNSPIVHNNPFDLLLSDFSEHLQCVTKEKKSQKSYISYIRTLNKVNGGLTIEWLKKAVKKKDPIENLSKQFDEFFQTNPDVQPQSQWKTGLRRLGEFVCGFTNSDTNLRSIRDFEHLACRLVAQSAIFCTKKVFDDIVAGKSGSNQNIAEKGNEFGSWYNCKYKRAYHHQKKGDYVDGVKLDDNTYANKAIKYAILEGLKKYGNIHGNDIHIFSECESRFEACHIWPNTCYDARYHTSVANLVLLPREIASLTDHCDAVKELLQYEAWKRFQFKPEDKDIPQYPQYYKGKDIIWRCSPEEKIKDNESDISKE